MRSCDLDSSNEAGMTSPKLPAAMLRIQATGGMRHDMLQLGNAAGAGGDVL